MPGKPVLVAILTFPLAFPGVVIGFHGHHARRAQRPARRWWATRWPASAWTFAYGLAGLFVGYLYFSIPRVILTVMAAVEKLDPSLEEAARSLGAGPWRVVRDVDAARADAGHAVAAGRSASPPAWAPSARRSRSPRSLDVLPLTIYNEFTNYANFGMAAALSIVLGLVTWAVLAVARMSSGAASPPAGARRAMMSSLHSHAAMRRGRSTRPRWRWLPFLIGPVVLSILAGLTRNYFVGLSSGLTLRWARAGVEPVRRHHLALHRRGRLDADRARW